MSPRAMAPKASRALEAAGASQTTRSAWAPTASLPEPAAKRNARVLAAVCVILLVGHWLDLYLLIMPETWSGPMAGPLEAIIPLGYAGLFFSLISRALAQAPLVPLHDPYLDESVNHET